MQSSNWLAETCLALTGGLFQACVYGASEISLD
jgi:hypothetical protein